MGNHRGIVTTPGRKNKFNDGLWKIFFFHKSLFNPFFIARYVNISQINIYLKHWIFGMLQFSTYLLLSLEWRNQWRRQHERSIESCEGYFLGGWTTLFRYLHVSGSILSQRLILHKHQDGQVEHNQHLKMTETNWYHPQLNILKCLPRWKL